MIEPINAKRGYALPKEVLIDELDKDKLVGFNKWFISARGDVYSQKWKKGKATTYKLHRVIMDAPVGMDVDHINGNPLDNRRSNLRICTHKENSRNTKLAKNNTSGAIGVRWDKTKNKWLARIKVDYKDIHIGRFNNFKDAVKARKDAEIKYFGEFAPSRSRTCTNN